MVKLEKLSKRQELGAKIGHYFLIALIIAIPVTLVTITYIVPFFRSFAVSFEYRDGISLGNYARVFDVYFGDIIFTIFVSVMSLVCVMTIAVFVGGWLTICSNRIVEFLFKIPLFVPWVVVGHAMRTFLAPRGLLNSMLSQIGIVDITNPPNIIFGAPGIIISLTWKQMAFALLLMMAAFRSVDRSYLEAARNYGASTFRQITGILFPLSRGAIGVTSVLILTSFLQNFSVVMMMGNAGGSRHIMINIFNIMTHMNDLPLANALGVVSYILALGAAIIYLKAGFKKNA